jgi:hypothetical protein
MEFRNRMRKMDRKRKPFFIFFSSLSMSTDRQITVPNTIGPPLHKLLFRNSVVPYP